MARSVGEAAANGLESGLNLGMAIVNQRRQQDRQDTLDAQRAEDRQRQIDRQRMTDQGAALDAQLKDLNTEGVALETSLTPPSTDVMQDYTRRVKAVTQARDQHYSKLSGVIVEDAHKGALEDLKALDANGGDVSKVKNLARAITVGTGQDPKVFIRPQGGPSPIEQAGQDFMEGVQNGDKGKMLAGANMIYGPKLQAGVGQPSPHGGTIVRKEVVDLVPDPKADPKDPKFIPVLKVYVDRGKDFKGPRGEFGETSSYTAPITEGRSSGDDARVRSLGLKDVLDFVGHNLQIAEQLNTPEGLAKLQQDQESSPFDPQEYLTALRRASVPPAKNVTDTKIIPAGGTAVTTTRNSRTGAVVRQESIQGNAKPAPADKITLFSDGIDKQIDQGVLSEEEGAQMKRDYVQRLATGSGDSTLQAKLKAIDDDPNLTDAQRAEQRKAVVSGIKPAAPGKGATASDKADMAVMGRRLQVLKDQRLALENEGKTALEEFKLASHDGNKKEVAAAKAVYDKRVAALQTKRSDLDGRISKISDELDNKERTTAKAEDGDSGPSLSSAKPAGGKVDPKDQAARDKDRGAVFKRELDEQEAALAKLTDPAAIERKKGDIAALKREMGKAGVKAETDAGSLKDAKPGKAPVVINKLPAGAKQIGTSGGKPVYETPDGKRFRGD